MLIESARRAEAAAKEMLGYVNDGSASCTEMREALAVCAAFMAAGSAFQAGAARIIAQAERHGDGGAQVLADAAGLSRRDAHSQVKTAEAIGAVPAVRNAVEAGRVSQANAKRLADAMEKTSAADVESDEELLAKAKSMRPEQFAREARRWTANHQADGGASEYRRLRARRCVRMWSDDDDGMVHLRGEFDPVTGTRIANRLREAAGRLQDDDKPQAADSSGRKRRSFDQCMADALDNLTGNNSSRAGNDGGKPFADICVVAHVDDETGELVAELPEGASGSPRRCSNNFPATPSSPASSMTARASPSGAPSPGAPSPSPNGNCSSPNGAAASTAAPTPASAKAITSSQPRRVGPPNSTTSSQPAGAATTASTTTTGGSTNAPTGGTPSTHPTASTTDQRGLRTTHRCCSSPTPSTAPAHPLPHQGLPHHAENRATRRAPTTSRYSLWPEASAGSHSVVPLTAPDPSRGTTSQAGGWRRVRATDNGPQARRSNGLDDRTRRPELHRQHDRHNGQHMISAWSARGCAWRKSQSLREWPSLARLVRSGQAEAVSGVGYVDG